MSRRGMDDEEEVVEEEQVADFDEDEAEEEEEERGGRFGRKRSRSGFIVEDADEVDEDEDADEDEDEDEDDDDDDDDDEDDDDEDNTISPSVAPPLTSQKRLITEEEQLEAERKRLKGDFSMYDDLSRPYSFRTKDGFLYRNKALIQIQKADDEYCKKMRNLSPFDAIPLPPNTELVSVTAVPLTITKDLRHIIIKCSKLALEDFNKKEGTNFVFATLIKSCRSIGYMYYITFEANDAAAPAATRNTFQAKVYVCTRPKDKEPEVMFCRMKPT